MLQNWQDTIWTEKLQLLETKRKMEPENKQQQAENGANVETSYVKAFILILSCLSPDTLTAGEPQSDQFIPLHASSRCCIREQGHRSSTAE